MAEFTPIQQEAVVLAASLDMIDDMVNLGRFEAPITDRPTNLSFKSSAEKRVFAILLGDFLAQPQPRGKRPPPFGLPVGGLEPGGSERTFLPYLAAVAAQPKIAMNAGELAQVVGAFATWLDTDRGRRGGHLPGSCRYSRHGYSITSFRTTPRPSRSS